MYVPWDPSIIAGLEMAFVKDNIRYLDLIELAQLLKKYRSYRFVFVIFSSQTYIYTDWNFCVVERDTM